MSANHTPGPWQIEGQARGGLLISAGLNEYRDGPAAYVGILKADFPRELNPADTTLIVAAPELMAALVKAEAFIAGFEGDELQDDVDCLLACIRLAIAEASPQ